LQDKKIKATMKAANIAKSVFENMAVLPLIETPECFYTGNKQDSLPSFGRMGRFRAGFLAHPVKGFNMGLHFKRYSALDEVWHSVAPSVKPAERRKADTMGEWIPFAEGRYRVERAVLLAADQTGIEVQDAVLEILEDSQGRRRLRGRGRVWNALLVQLLDGGEELDLLLDLGGEFKYRLRHPDIHGGKVFTAGVQSFIQFLPRQPWEALSEPDFTLLMSRVRILSDGPS
jgi:hypothetical protein